MMQCRQADPDMSIASISVHRISLGCYQHIVRRNLSHKIRTFNRAGGNIHLAVVSDGYILGLINYDLGMWASHRAPGEMSLLLDLAVPSDKYKHLAKLILRVALSREVRLLVEAMGKARASIAKTTVFSDHPVSMKYRGIFKLIDRQQQPTGTFKLRYVGEFTNKSISEHFREWLAEEAAISSSSGGSADAGTATVQVAGVGSSPALRSIALADAQG